MTGDGRSAHKTDERLHESAVQLFALRGYSGTTTRQIAAAAGVTVGSIYNHVASKQDLLFDVMRRTHQEALARLDAALIRARDPVSALRAAVRSHALFHAEQGALVAVTYQEMGALDPRHRKAIIALRDQYGQKFKDIVRRGIKDGLFHVDEPELAVLAILSMGIQIYTWFRPGGRDSASKVADTYGAFALSLVGYAGDAPARPRRSGAPLARGRHG
ncbi:MAG TPA: TetR family transcriptional regulator [Candidatus Limnocylindrales bacterium]|nr:TetR family transcriptional regulator [Candidatus Limnocylindrales bacterium]